MRYERRDSALHAARAGAGAAYCLALGTVALLYDNPVVLAATIVAVLAAGALAGAGATLRRAALLAAPLALAVALVNPLISRDGLTVVLRLGEVPVLGRLDVTAEALAYGGVLGLRVAAIALAAALFTAAVDPDELLRLVRRVSFRSALSASLATRMVPVLGRDAARMAEAQRTLPAPARASRAALVGAVAANALDRAVDVAAALELRGYGSARRAPRAAPRPWSRHDLAIAAAAVAILALAVCGRALGVAAFHPYPALGADLGAATLALAAAIPVAAIAPLLERRGIAR